MRINPLMAVVNESSVLTDDQVKNSMYAWQNAIHYDFRPHWNAGATLQFYGDVSLVPSTAWVLHIMNDSDQAGALGYHDETAEGHPLMKVFAKTDRDYGYDSDITTMHEIFEALADPYICLAAQTSNTQFYGYEVGDPVEDDQFAYTRKGRDGKLVKISDFVTPNWFQPGFPGPYDKCEHVTKPLQVLSGGYVSVFTSGKGWTQYQQKGAELVEVERDGSDPRFRDRGAARPLS